VPTSSDIVLSTKVGEGSFGVVFEGTFKDQNVAVKFQTLSEDLAEISQLR
jgi:predicted Ser/Thr protein kinase